MSEGGRTPAGGSGSSNPDHRTPHTTGGGSPQDSHGHSIDSLVRWYKMTRERNAGGKEAAQMTLQ